MARPEVQPELAVREGVCYALFAYDAGLALDLDESERRITALTQRASIRHKHRAPKYFNYRPHPLRVTQEGTPIAVGSFRTTPSIEAVLYDFGAVSVTYQIPLQGPLARLVSLSEELYERATLQRVGQLQVENAVLFEGVNNALKLLGDQYLARVYRLVSERFHLAEWDASILRKIQTLESIYQKLADQAANRRTEVLEWIVI